jgi:hypothetical protein
MSADAIIPNRTAALAEILWGFIQDMDKVRHWKRKPSLDKLLRVAHAVSQLSGAYVKVTEAGEIAALEARLAAVEALLQGSTNGHHEGRAPQAY